MNNIQTWAIGAGVILAVASFLKFCPKKKIIGFLSPFFYAGGKAISKILLTKLTKKAAETIEEGVILTVTDSVIAALGDFKKGFLEDNSNYDKNKLDSLQ